MLITYLKHLALHLNRCTGRTRMRSTRHIPQRLDTAIEIPVEPLVTRLTRNTEPRTQLSERHIRSSNNKTTERHPLRLNRPSKPRHSILQHRQPPKYRVLPMSPNACYLCLQSIHSLEGGPKRRRTEGAEGTGRRPSASGADRTSVPLSRGTEEERSDDSGG